MELDGDDPRFTKKSMIDMKKYHADLLLQLCKIHPKKLNDEILREILFALLSYCLAINEKTAFDQRTMSYFPMLHRGGSDSTHKSRQHWWLGRYVETVSRPCTWGNSLLGTDTLTQGTISASMNWLLAF